MRKLSLRGVLGLAIAMIMAVSCIFDQDSQFDQLETLANALQGQDAVVSVTENADGSFIIKFKEVGNITINKGLPGQEGAVKTMVEDPDCFLFIFDDGSVISLPRYYETCVLTFEDADYKGPSNIKSYWSSLIDEPQYGGPILYGDGCTWADENNTFLSGSVLAYDAASWSGGLSGGGIAISNYANGMLTGADYTRQLEVYNPELDGAGRSGNGNEGSNNFAIVYDGGAWGSNPAALVMKNGKTVVESVYVNNTCYVLNSLINGDGYNPPMADDGYFKVTATGYVDGEATGSTDFILASNDEYVTFWVMWDLSCLGAVDKVVFTLSGSPDLYGPYGFNAPAYVAIDDVTVRVYPE